MANLIQLSNIFISQVKILYLIVVFLICISTSCKKEPETPQPEIYGAKYMSNEKVGYMEIDGYIIDSMANKIAWKKLYFRGMSICYPPDSNKTGYFTCRYINRLDKFVWPQAYVLYADTIVTETDTLSGDVTMYNCLDRVFYGEKETGYFYTTNIIAR